MERRGGKIFFNLTDHRRVDELRDEIEAAEAPDVYRSALRQQKALRVELYALRQKGASAGEQASAQEAADARHAGIDNFMSELARLATDEIAAALAPEVCEIVFFGGRDSG